MAWSGELVAAVLEIGEDLETEKAEHSGKIDGKWASGGGARPGWHAGHRRRRRREEREEKTRWSSKVNQSQRKREVYRGD